MGAGLRIIVSPAKRMDVVEGPPVATALPAMLPAAEKIVQVLRSMGPSQLQALWNCSDALAAENVERLRTMDLPRATTPAVISYVGIQYQHLAPAVMSERALGYLDSHLRIVSGLYGLLRPFDAVTPYRLEMGAKLQVNGSRDLYAYWGSSVYEELLRDGAGDGSNTGNGDVGDGVGGSGVGLVVNLASVEYARAVVPFATGTTTQMAAIPATRVVTCLFGSVRDGRLIQRATEAKACRGTFVRWCAEQGIEEESQLTGFSERGYRLEPSLCSASGDMLAFIRYHSERS